MQYDSLKKFLAKGRSAIGRGPLAMVFIEDSFEIDTTLRHHLELGFEPVIVFAPAPMALPDDLDGRVIEVTHDTRTSGSVETAVNAVIAAAPGVWMYYCFNGEYLFHPFAEDRSVAEMLAFHTEERRSAMVTFVVDLYGIDGDDEKSVLSLDHARLDRTGYFALARKDPMDGSNLERQLDFFGGLRWRFEEHIPKASRRIDRIGLFRAKTGLRLLPGHLFSDPEYNTYACPWHNNLTSAICSFRTAKALRTNPGTKFDVRAFGWHGSVPFEWHSAQLMDLGLIEPGQWF
ncbi:MAG: hypothetical protein AAGF74_01985 [Pseudomonadota bacterium]